MVVGGGLLALAFFALVGKQMGGSAAAAAKAALWFVPLWFVAAAVNLSIGVRHGYTVIEELPIGLVVFGVPALLAIAIWWRFSGR
jgi:hypothetical protein